MNKDWPGWRNKSTRQRLLTSLSDDEVAALFWHWPFWARADQLPPRGKWTSWLMLGGRGAGKTRAGAEWVRGRVEARDKKRAARHIALVGETYAAARAAHRAASPTTERWHMQIAQINGQGIAGAPLTIPLPL